MKLRETTYFINVILLACCASSAIAQNLVTNPAFDTELAGWDSLAGSGQWDPLDAGGSVSSGSALITGAGPGTTLSQVLAQCIQVVSGWHYDFGSRAFVPSGMSASAYAFVKINYYSDSLCSKFVSAEGGSTLLFDVDIWTEIFGTEQVPDGANYVRIALAVGKDSDDPVVSVHHDDVYLMAATIFTDGFETGDTQAWSSTMP